MPEKKGEKRKDKEKKILKTVSYENVSPVPEGEVAGRNLAEF